MKNASVGKMVTVIEVAKSMGLELPNELAWQVGSSVASAYRKIYGTQPMKDLRPKTGGGGTHCFAIYPPTFVPVIQDAISRAGAEREKQSTLF